MTRSHLTYEQIHQIVPGPASVQDALKVKLEDHDTALDTLEGGGGDATGIDGPTGAAIVDPGDISYGFEIYSKSTDGSPDTINIRTSDYNASLNVYANYGGEGAAALIAAPRVFVNAGGSSGTVHVTGNADVTLQADTITLQNGPGENGLINIAASVEAALTSPAADGLTIVRGKTVSLASGNGATGGTMQIGAYNDTLGFFGAYPEVVQQTLPAIPTPVEIRALLVAYGLCAP